MKRLSGTLIIGNDFEQPAPLDGLHREHEFLDAETAMLTSETQHQQSIIVFNIQGMTVERIGEFMHPDPHKKYYAIREGGNREELLCC